MFLPSDKTINCLCNALYALPGWWSLLTEFGLASQVEYVDMMNTGDGEVEASFWDWQALRSHLQDARQDNPEQLRLLCSEIVRRKERYGNEAKDATKFSDLTAQLEVALQEDSKSTPGIAQLADEAINRAIEMGTLPTCQQVNEHLQLARNYFGQGKHNDCMTNLRLALKYVLQGIAQDLAQRRNQTLTPMKEDEVREYEKLGS